MLFPSHITFFSLTIKVNFSTRLHSPSSFHPVTCNSPSSAHVLMPLAAVHLNALWLITLFQRVQSEVAEPFCRFHFESSSSCSPALLLQLHGANTFSPQQNPIKGTITSWTILQICLHSSLIMKCVVKAWMSDYPQQTRTETHTHSFAYLGFCARGSGHSYRHVPAEEI